MALNKCKTITHLTLHHTYFFIPHTVPMAETSTPHSPTHSSTTSRRAAKASTNIGPKRSTIDFLRQFARAYSYQPTIHPGLADIVAN